MNDIIEKLKNAISAAPKGQKVVTIHLFGIRHADRLNGVNLKELAGRAGIGESYGAELHKGVRLAQYVIIKS